MVRVAPGRASSVVVMGSGIYPPAAQPGPPRLGMHTWRSNGRTDRTDMPFVRGADQVASDRAEDGPGEAGASRSFVRSLTWWAGTGRTAGDGLEGGRLAGQQTGQEQVGGGGFGVGATGRQPEDGRAPDARQPEHGAGVRRDAGAGTRLLPHPPTTPGAEGPQPDDRPLAEAGVARPGLDERRLDDVRRDLDAGHQLAGAHEGAGERGGNLPRGRPGQ